MYLCDPYPDCRHDSDDTQDTTAGNGSSATTMATVGPGSGGGGVPKYMITMTSLLMMMILMITFVTGWSYLMSLLNNRGEGEVVAVWVMRLPTEHFAI